MFISKHKNTIKGKGEWKKVHSLQLMFTLLRIQREVSKRGIKMDNTRDPRTHAPQLSVIREATLSPIL